MADSEQKPPTSAWWPLARLLAEVAPGSRDDWTWQEEHDDLWFGEDDDSHAMDDLATSMQENGQRTPVLIGDDGRLWDGHHRVVAAMRLGFDRILVVRYSDLTDDEQIAMMLDSIGDLEAAGRA